MKEKDSEQLREKEIAEEISKIRSEFESSIEDKEEVEMSFLDRINRLIQLILNDDSFSIYKALDKQSLEKWQKSKIKRFVFKNHHKVIYLLLLATITGFLVSEALTFYAIEGVISSKTYVKAILTEVCFLFLSTYRTSSIMEKGLVYFLRAGIFALMLFVITSETFTLGTKYIGNVDSIKQQIVLLEDQIKQKEATINFYMEKGWGVNVRKHTDDKNELVKELLDLKKQQALGANEKVSKIEEYKMYGRAFFRVLLLLISTLIARRLFKF